MGKSLKTKTIATDMPMDYIFASFDKDVNSEYFATVSHSIENHRLRLYNTRSGNMTHDYQLSSGELVSSLSWGNITSVDQEQVKAKKSSKRARSANSTDASIKVVVIGTKSGKVLLYSVEEDKVIRTLSKPDSPAIKDSIINDQGTTLYTLSETGSIVEWSIEEEEPTSEWNTKLEDGYKLALNNQGSLLAVGGDGQIELWDVKKSNIAKTLINEEDKQQINHLMFSSVDDVLISGTEKGVYIWNTRGKKKNVKVIASFSVKEGLRQLDVINGKIEQDQTLHLLAVSTKGTVYLWKTSLPVKDDDESTIKIVASKQVQIPIVWATFIKAQKTISVVIVRGSSVKPILETVGIMDDKNNLLNEIILTRQIAGINNDVGSDQEEEEDDNKKEQDMQHTPETLIKALQSDNKPMVLQYLKQVSQVEDIDNTIRRLPYLQVHGFLLLLVDQVERTTIEQGKGLRLWLKQLVSAYYDKLKDDHKVMLRLAALARVLNLQANQSLPKMYALRGRAEMIQQQLDIRSKRDLLEEEDELLELEESMDENEEYKDETQHMLTDDDDEDGIMHLHAKDEEDMFMEEVDEMTDEEDSDLDEDSDDSM